MKRFRAFLARLRPQGFDRWDAVIALGCATMAAGAGMIYRPAGVVLAGIFITVAGLLGAAHPEKAEAS